MARVAVRVSSSQGCVSDTRGSQIDLAEAGVDAIGRRVGGAPVQPRAGLGAGGVALWRAGDVERPGQGIRRPRSVAPLSCRATAYSTAAGTSARCAAS